MADYLSFRKILRAWLRLKKVLTILPALEKDFIFERKDISPSFIRMIESVPER